MTFGTVFMIVSFVLSGFLHIVYQQNQFKSDQVGSKSFIPDSIVIERLYCSQFTTSKNQTEQCKTLLTPTTHILILHMKCYVNIYIFFCIPAFLFFPIIVSTAFMVDHRASILHMFVH